MADPVTLTAISLATTAAAAGTSALGNLMSGSANASMANYKAGVAQLNQKIQKQNADYARYTGEVEAQQVGLKGRYGIGAAKVAQGASNIDVNSGSSVKVRDSMQDIVSHDEGTVRAGAARQAYGYDIQGMQYGTQSSIDKLAAAQAKKAGIMNAFGSIVGGASSVSSKWLQAGSVGLV